MFGSVQVRGLRFALEELGSADLKSLSDQELEAHFSEIHRAAEILEAERLRCLPEIERRQAFRRDGHLSTASWLAARFKVARGVASEQVRMAGALQAMPHARDALASGEVSTSSLRVLASAREAHPEAFAGDEARLVEAARALPVRQLEQTVADWRLKQDERDAKREAEQLWRRRRLRCSRTLHGMVRMDGEFDPETGESVLTALRAHQDAEARCGGKGDHRTPDQRMADALGEICRRFLDRGNRPVVGGERPHLTVTVDLEALEGRGDGGSRFDHTGPVGAEIVRRLGCDASVTRMVTRGRSEPLDVGRQTPVVSAAMRRALVVRDGGCVFPGCGRPPPWTDAHHVLHWARGGRTALSNLVLLCRPHHRVVHEGGFGLDMVEGRPVFRRPDGSVLEERAPP
jgi:Domain of unknown function (DUF222)/HNH endonuclease